MLLLIDESAPDTTPMRCCYVVASGLVVAEDADRTRAAARNAVSLPGVPRKRPFHWTDEGPVVKASMLQVVADHAVDVVLAVASEVPVRHQEETRQRLLRQVLDAVQRHNLSAVMIESRDGSQRNQGQNHYDYTTLIEARHAGLLAPQVRYDWVGKGEPLMWLPDAVAGAAGAEQVHGQTDWLAKLRAADAIRVIGP